MTLLQMLEVLEEATPQMAELSMLTDAIKQLDELFLLVVVGEFNSGKSSVINALLGSRSVTLHKHIAVQFKQFGPLLDLNCVPNTILYIAL